MMRSESRLRGMGQQIIKILACELRDIAELPDEVEIVKVIGPDQVHVTPCSMIPEPREPYAYIHVKSRYAIRCPEGAPMTIETFEEFMTRWQDLWSQKR